MLGSGSGCGGRADVVRSLPPVLATADRCVDTRSVTAGAEPPPGPGWYPDPWGLAPYRWWSGSSWDAAVSPEPPSPSRDRSGWGAAFSVSAVLLFLWVGLWFAVLPLLLLSDADNGVATHDLRTLWIPEVLPGLITAVVCLVMVQEDRRRKLSWRLLAVPCVLLGVTVVIDVLAIALHKSG